MDREVRIERMLPQDIRGEMDRQNLLLIPIAPLEWHGPHLPYGTDPLNAYAFAVLAAQRLGGLVHPCIYAGTEVRRPSEMVEAFGLDASTEVVGMDMPGLGLKSCYMPPEVFKEVVRPFVNTAVQVGFRNIVLVNGHGALDQARTLKELCAEISGNGVSVAYFINFDTGDQEFLNAIGHADTTETEATLVYHPELVHLENLPEGRLRSRDYAVVDSETFLCKPAKDFTCRADPRDADFERGRRWVDEVVARLGVVLREMQCGDARCSKRG